MNENKDLNENPNSYNYNPNRPQANASGQSDTQKNRADTQKVVDTGAKVAAEYLAPGVGGMAYDAAKKVPGVGEAIDNATGTVADAANKIPGVKETAKGLNDAGVTDAVSSATDIIGSKGAEVAKGASGATKGVDAASKGTSFGSDTLAPAMPTRKNADFNSRVRSEEALDSSLSTGDGSDGIPEDNESNSSLPPADIDSSDAASVPIQDDLSSLDNTNSDNTDNNGEVTGDIGNLLFKNIWDKYKIPIIAGIGVLVFFFIIMFAIFGGDTPDMQGMGYIDSQCNFNETKVNVTNCYQSSSEVNSLATYDIDDLVVRLAYAYTNGNNYSDDAIKALMIMLKTNILSYGNYNSSDKEVDVRICDVFSNYEDIPEDSSDELWMLDISEDNLSGLENLYDDISNYLYISSSYRSTISNLSSQNILSFNNNTLNEFEDLASDGNSYSQILNHFYNTSAEEESTDNVYRETLFLGDSRMQGILNAGVINRNNTIYGVGYGYNWLVGNGDFLSSNTNATSGGISGINSLMRDNANYNIVIWLGVNDLSNVNLYYEKYRELARGDWHNHNIYIVSVGPIVTGANTYATNDAINNFNSTISSLISSSGLDNLFYIDLGMSEEDINSSDGIHYSPDNYISIYNDITSNLDTTLNSDYQLYNLTSYCTYYTLTENTAYWWPIGSSEATQGNIYGGEPSATVVTSEFGRRNTGIAGASTNHKGIDIAKNGSACGEIIIASRSGTVIAVTDNGGARGTYVKIDHGDGVVTLYQHMQEASYTVEQGDHVEQGQMIGLVGNTGVGSGCHLHFEVIVNGVEVDPLDYVDPENPRPVQSYGIGNIGDTDGTASANKEAICSALLDSGYSVNAVAGMLVNISAEGSFLTTNLENCYEENRCCKINGKNYGYCVHTEIGSFGSDMAYTNGVDSGAYPREKFINDRAGYGLIQWTSSGRKAGLYDYAKSQNKSIGSLSVQFEYLLQELQYDSYALTYKYITGNYSAYDIANTFCLNFERPSDKETACPARARANIDSMLQYVQNGCSD